MPKPEFIAELVGLGYEVENLEADRVAVAYEIPCGRLAGQKIKLGFAVPGEFPLNPPGGPHVSPRILPMNAQAVPHPNGGVHDSPFGSEWQYWSRPLSHWQQTQRRVKDIMAHVRHLFDTV